MPKNWSPLKDANWFMEKLKEEVTNCDATGMASRAAGAQGMLEAAFYTHEIDEDKMQRMKEEIGEFIGLFDKQCKCHKK